MGVDKQDRIKQRAYEIWESSGRPHGAHEVHWQQASSEIDAEDAAPPALKPAKAPKAPKLASAPIAPQPTVSASLAPKLATKPRTKSKI